MRRSICQTEPSVALAGDISTWKFSYTTAANLAEGAQLRFDLLMQDRPCDWELPQSDPNEKENLIWLELPNGKAVYAEEIEIPNQYAPVFNFTLPSELKAGETLTILMGTPLKDKEKGNQAQTTTQRRRPFHLYIDPKSKGDFKDPEIFTIDVRGNVLDNIQIMMPSLVAKNRRFDIVVRFEDKYKNLTANAPEGLLIELSYEHLRENLNWKLFVPETGFIVLPNLYFNETGVYRIQLKNSMNDSIFYSSPIKCLSDTAFSVYWGTLHGESEKFDASHSIDPFYRHMRDEIGLQFTGVSPFEGIDETTNDAWKAICTQTHEHNEENRFITFLGLQWFGNEGEGLRQILYWKDNKPLMRKKDMKYSALKKIYKTHTSKEILLIPSFSMAKGYETKFDDYNQELERVVEIYNAWGSSECLESEGNPRPIKSTSKDGIFETEKGSIRKALNQNMRFGFVAGGLDDRGVYSDLFESDQIQYSPGLTAIVAIEQTRDTLMHALYSRSCYATTGANIVLGFNIAGSQMGTELSSKLKPGLTFNRHITGFVCGTTPLKEVTIIRNGKEFKSFRPNEASFEFEYDDLEQLASIALKSPDERPPFAYYYLRVIQEDGHIAWSSPIWVDLEESTAVASKKMKKK